MLKRINWKAIFKGFAWLVCLAGMVVLMSFIDINKQKVKCTKVEILIPGADNFIEREEIDAILKQGEGALIGRNLETINIHQIEKNIKSNPYIAFVKVYADMDGIIHIEIKQRQPVLRIINAGGQDYYIDSDGLKMPMSPNFTANVLVATGNILEGFSGRIDTLLTPLARDLYKTALYSKRDTLWDAQFEQIYVNEKNDIELIPRVGNQRIILGNADSLETKMNNLLAFYKQAMPKVGWNVYKTINLKYYNQIVCEKYDSLAVKKAIAVVIDTNFVQKKATDSVIRDVIKEEIKKATAEDANEKPVVQKPVVVAKPTITKEKVAEKTVAKSTTTGPAKTTVTEKGKTKPVTTTKEKTDTKKNK
ncbi:cell division protein FtsQ [Pedobacter polaris]|uniref:Cell division protein FtsQ n=1 Tax=Pedobacter polaris TaxID=2571273 RepID=A0A4U1CNE0_9SPHI|nr:cell division protein FtsQ [Pedobacter polaris]TKC08213.1 cell division protein FtsQ [Pedobacter polaris]